MSTIPAFKTPPTAVKNVYTYTFTEQNIRRSDGYLLVVSAGAIMPQNFTVVHRLLYGIQLISSGATIEAQAVEHTKWSKVKARPITDEPVSLNAVIAMVERQLDLIAPWRQEAFHFRSLANRISDLLDGHYFGTGRQGAARIETIGERLYGLTVDLLWALDNDRHGQLREFRGEFDEYIEPKSA